MESAQTSDSPSPIEVVVGLSLLEAVRYPLVDLLRATADWLDSPQGEPLAEPEEDLPPKWVPNDRGGFDPA